MCVADGGSLFARSSYIYSCIWLVLFECRVLESICTYCFKVCESTEQSRTRLVWISLHYVFTALIGVFCVRTFFSRFGSWCFSDELVWCHLKGMYMAYMRLILYIKFFKLIHSKIHESMDTHSESQKIYSIFSWSSWEIPQEFTL